MNSPQTALSTEYQTMMSYTQGMWTSQIVRTVAALSIPEHLEEGPRSAREIADAASTDPEAMFRLLRVCVALGLVSFDPAAERFCATDLLATLRRGAPGTLANWSMVQTMPGHWRSWAEATDAVRAGRTRSARALGSPLFDYLADNPEESALFSDAMTDLTGPVAPEAAAVIDTSGAPTIVDVGGANGTFVHEFLRRDPAARGIVHDLPGTSAGARAEAEGAGLLDRLTVVGGDFFDAVPPGDLYLLKFVLHDWQDDDCVRILENCRKAMAPGGRVCIVEMVVGPVEDPGLDAALMDMNMLVITEGKERDMAEFDALLTRAGLRRAKRTAISRPYSVIEAVAAD